MKELVLLPKNPKEAKMPQKHNSGEPDFGDWNDWVANGIATVVLGVIIGALFGGQVERVGISWGCVAGILLFAVIGFRRQIQCLFCLFLLKIQKL